MPITNGVGHSAFTEMKQKHLREILKTHMAIVKAITCKYSYLDPYYYYIDATAGPGKIGGEEGSPLVFIDSARDIQLDYHAYFIEKVADNCLSLMKAISNTHHGNICICNQQYEYVLPQICQEYNDKQFGVLYIDNTNCMADLETLKTVVPLRPKIDILMYLSATNIKRTPGETLDDYIEALGKEHWLIRKSYYGDKHYFTFLFGYNGPKSLLDKYQTIGLYHIKNDIGRGIYDKMRWTNAERKERLQKTFPFIEHTKNISSTLNTGLLEAQLYPDQKGCVKDAK